MKESPGPPQNFSRIIWLSGIGTVARFRAFLIFLSRRLQGGWRAAPVPGEGVPSAVACPLGRSSVLPLVLILPPIPPSPFPGGEGGKIFSLFRRGLRPRHPGIRPFAALTVLSKQAPRRVATFYNPGSRRPGKAPRLGFQRAMPVPRPFSPRGCKG